MLSWIAKHLTGMQQSLEILDENQRDTLISFAREGIQLHEKKIILDCESVIGKLID